MHPILFLSYLIAEARSRARKVIDDKGGPDAGYSTETVLVTALIVVLAIAAIAVIATKVIAKANSINL